MTEHDRRKPADEPPLLTDPLLAPGEVPVLRDRVSGNEHDDPPPPPAAAPAPEEIDEALLASVHTQLASATFELTEDLLRTAWSGAEARLFAQVLEGLRQELPEIVETVLREHLERRDRDS